MHGFAFHFPRFTSWEKTKKSFSLTMGSGMASNSAITRRCRCNLFTFALPLDIYHSPFLPGELFAWPIPELHRLRTFANSFSLGRTREYPFAFCDPHSRLDLPFFRLALTRGLVLVVTIELFCVALPAVVPPPQREPEPAGRSSDSSYLVIT